MAGGLWVALIPEDSTDERSWEFDILTGRIVRTRP